MKRSDESRRGSSATAKAEEERISPAACDTVDEISRAFLSQTAVANYLLPENVV
jgi:hypothetical protein